MNAALVPLLVVGAVACLALAARARRPRRAGGAPGWLRLARRLPLPVPLGARPSDAAERLVAAGLAREASPDDLARARVLGAATGGLAAAALAPLATLALIAAPVLAVLGGLAPERLLARRAGRRRDAMRRALPEVLELLAICVEGGMALDPALQVATRHARGPLGEELRAALDEIALGAPRRSAYAALAERSGVPEVATAVGALVQAEELGTPLSAALGSQADATREAARRAALERAARAGPRIQLVVAVLMVPAALILIVGAFAIELTRQVGGVLGAP